MNLKAKHIFSLVAWLIFLGGCTTPEKERQVDPIPMSVKIQRVEKMTYQIPVRVTGFLGTTTQMKLSFKTGGIVSRINVREGMGVSAGEVLAVLDLSEIRAQVSQATIALEKAQRDMDRAMNLYHDSVATLEQYQNAGSAFELARAQKQIADFNLLHSRIKAPADGKIMKILVETSEVIGPGYPAILFASTEDDWVVRASITDKDIVKLGIGDSAHITMDAFPGRKFLSEVTGLGNVADPVTGTYESELKILEADPQFRTGFFSRADIYPAGKNRSLVVPLEALLNASDHKAHVFVYAQTGDQAVQPRGTVTKRIISTGRILGDRVVVLDGLEEGEWIVTEGAKFLRPDMEVIPVHYNENKAQ
ncbi:MAG: efflux RND transporter periplasmic adaptor subunit [Bacteroidales bacterium]